MKLLFLLIPISLIIIAIAIYVFIWALKNRQFDDLSSPAMIPLFDDKSEKLEVSSEELGVSEELAVRSEQLEVEKS